MNLLLSHCLIDLLIHLLLPYCLIDLLVSLLLPHYLIDLPVLLLIILCLKMVLETLHGLVIRAKYHNLQRIVEIEHHINPSSTIEHLRSAWCKREGGPCADAGGVGRRCSLCKG